jgi:Sec-independent protein secretion pathway component TatC
MCLLYELGIIFARFVSAPPPKPAAADAWGEASSAEEQQVKDRS